LDILVERFEGKADMSIDAMDIVDAIRSLRIAHIAPL